MACRDTSSSSCWPAGADWDLPPPEPGAFCLEQELRVNTRLRVEDLRDLAEWARQQGLPTATVSIYQKLNSGCIVSRLRCTRGRNSFHFRFLGWKAIDDKNAIGVENTKTRNYWTKPEKLAFGRHILEHRLLLTAFFIPQVELVKFLHRNDYSVEDTKKRLKKFHSYRVDYPDLFIDFDLELPCIKSILEIVTVAILPRKTPDNHRIIYSGLRTSDTTKHDFTNICRVLYMAIESIFLTEPTISGIVFLHDMELVTMAHFLKAGIRMPKKFSKYTLDLMPLKQGDIHLVQCSGFIDAALKMMWRLGLKKGWEMLHVHKVNDFEALHARIPKECLPSDFDGCLPSVIELTEITLNRLKDCKESLNK